MREGVILDKALHVYLPLLLLFVIEPPAKTRLRSALRSFACQVLPIARIGRHKVHK